MVHKIGDIIADLAMMKGALRAHNRVCHMLGTDPHPERGYLMGEVAALAADLEAARAARRAKKTVARVG